MNGRAFITVAANIIQRGDEASWRTAAGRAYYALMLELRDSFTMWGLSKPAPATVHQTIKRRVYCSTDRDMKRIGRWLDRLRDLRVFADYELDNRPEFATASEARRSISQAQDAIHLLDSINADASRRSAIINEIQRVAP